MGEQFSGRLFYVLLVSILDAALLSWVLVLWYRRSVRKLMREPARSDSPNARAPIDPLMFDSSEPSSGFTLIEAGSTDGPALLTGGTRRQLRRLVIAYAVGAMLHSAVITFLTMRADAPAARRLAWFIAWWANAWPVVPTLIALLVLDRPKSVRLALWYLVGGASTTAALTLAVQLTRGSVNSAALTNAYLTILRLVLVAAFPVLLLLLTGWRRVRAVTPLALAMTLLFGIGLQVSWTLFVNALDVPVLRSVILKLAARTSPAVTSYVPFMLLSLPVGWIAWRLLQLITSGYDRKRFSDVQLLVDCWWLIVTAEEIASTLWLHYGPAAAAGGLVAFGAYRAGVALVLSIGSLGGANGRRLLLLRVFGYERRTESLFDRIAQQWRFHGPVQLIGGVDLAERTIDPGDVLAFLGGTLRDRYVGSVDEIDQRIDNLDNGRDPDGRFRVNEVYCHDDTWRPTLEALLDASDRVLMDLRSFSKKNAGCIFELEQLIRKKPTTDVVFVCDRSTDVALLERILGQTWIAAASEGHARGDARVSIVRIERQSRRELGILMRRLLADASPVTASPP